MPEFGKLLMILGGILLLAGAALWSGVGKGWLGHLPGDIHYNKDNVSFHFPIVTCLIISALLSFLMWLFRR